MKEIKTIGVDLAKNVIQVHGVDAQGNPVLMKQLRRDRVALFFANLPSCLVGMEACGSAHYWARQLEKLGHRVRLIAPQFVKPYVKTNKNDVADAEAIREAVSGQICASYRSKTLSNRPYWRCIVLVKDS